MTPQAPEQLQPAPPDSLAAPHDKGAAREAVRRAVGAGLVRLLLSRGAGLLGLAGVVVAILFPPRGLGETTCTLQRSTGVPCPGCGLTRSVSSIFQGHWDWAWSYNPFGFAFALGFALTAATLVLPPSAREAAIRRLEPHDHLLARLIIYASIALVAFGLWRAAMVMAGDPGLAWWADESVIIPPFIQD